MVTTEEREAPVQESRDPSLVDMAEMLAQIADTLLSAALVMATLSEKEVPKGSLIDRLLQASDINKILSAYTQITTGSSTTVVTPQYQPAYQPVQQPSTQWQQGTTILPSTTVPTWWGSSNKWHSIGFNMAQFDKAVTDFVEKATGWTS